MTHKVTILGVNISQMTKQKALQVVAKVLAEAKASRPFFIATPNPEMLVLAYQDSKFCHVLNSADLAIPDGIGLLLASRFLQSATSPPPSPARRGIKGEVLSERISGVDFMLDLCKLAAKKGYTVGLLGGREGVAEKTAEVLRKKFSMLTVIFAVEDVSDLSNLGHLRERKPDLLFVAFGAPRQEEFIYELRIKESRLRPASPGFGGQVKNLRIKVAMGVGGSFDIISGRIKRAPLWMQKTGLEWLWRLMMEPGRIKKIIRATVVFPWLVFCEKLRRLLRRPAPPDSSQ